MLCDLQKSTQEFAIISETTDLMFESLAAILILSMLIVKYFLSNQQLLIICANTYIGTYSKKNIFFFE